jgi:hypothetical protein
MLRFCIPVLLAARKLARHLLACRRARWCTRCPFDERLPTRLNPLLPSQKARATTGVPVFAHLQKKFVPRSLEVLIDCRARERGGARERISLAIWQRTPRTQCRGQCNSRPMYWEASNKQVSSRADRSSFPIDRDRGAEIERLGARPATLDRASRLVDRTYD